MVKHSILWKISSQECEDRKKSFPKIWTIYQPEDWSIIIHSLKIAQIFYELSESGQIPFGTYLIKNIDRQLFLDSQFPNPPLSTPKKPGREQNAFPN
jgi:hypothetical protein